jgi:hypothetical protein
MVIGGQYPSSLPGLAPDAHPERMTVSVMACAGVVLDAAVWSVMDPE